MGEQGVQGGADRTAREKNVVNENNVLVPDVEADVRFLDHRFGAEGGEVIAIERDIKRADGDWGIFHALDDLSQALGQGHAAATDSDQTQGLDAAVFFNDFMGEANQGAFYF